MLKKVQESKQDLEKRMSDLRSQDEEKQTLLDNAYKSIQELRQEKEVAIANLAVEKEKRQHLQQEFDSAMMGEDGMLTLSLS